MDVPKYETWQPEHISVSCIDDTIKGKPSTFLTQISILLTRLRRVINVPPWSYVWV